MQFKNPTSKSKAVKVKGGAVVVPPNSSKKIEGRWSDDQMAAMKKAGLEISGKASQPEPEKSEGAA